MGKVEENKKKKKDAIVNSAFSLFINNGINDTSIADIMKKAELAKGTFYLYFKDKYEVRDYLIRRKATQVFERAIEDLEASDIEEFDDKIIFIIDNVLDQLDGNKILLKFIFKNLSWGLFRHSMEHVQVYDSEGQIDIFGKFNELTDGKIRNVEMLLFLIVELVSSTAYSVILYKQPVELPELKEELYPVIRQMIHLYTIND
ncbi:MAG: TetR/AcrR family transcriptional regulator [Lachnospiraceae bacterium]|nr:TetR/AcrR family transcriptional regulator [Lachnospiraceae bacterium]